MTLGLGPEGWGTAFWLLPFGLLGLSFLMLALEGRAKTERRQQSFAALAGVLTMSALLSIQLHNNIRGESEIREEVAKLSKPLPFPVDAQAHSIEQSIRQSRLTEIVQEADRMGPWMMVFVSVVLGMTLQRLLEAYRSHPKPNERET